MNLELNNNDCIFGDFTAEDPHLEVDSVVSGSFEHGGGSTGYEWRLISHSSLDARVLDLANSEDGIEWKGELSKTNPPFPRPPVRPKSWLSICRLRSQAGQCSSRVPASLSITLTAGRSAL
jgi:hypothetical protein